MYVNKLFTYLSAHISKSERCFNVKSSTYYFHMKTKILADFQICITVPLIQFLSFLKLFINPFYLPTNCLSVFDQFVGLVLQELTHFVPIFLFISILSSIQGQQRRIQNSVKYLKWSFLRNYLTAFSH